MGERHRFPDPETTVLARGKTVRQYREWKQDGKLTAIATLIHQRFSERYYVPTIWSHHGDDPKDDRSHSFTIMAVSCLMVESIECFRRGLPDSNRQSERMFCDYFQREPEFIDLRPLAHDFYKHIRCGILHQDETTGQWRLAQVGPLLEHLEETRWVNAREFADRVHRSLQQYCKQLEAAQAKEPIWINAFAKLKSVCKHSGVKDLTGL